MPELNWNSGRIYWTAQVRWVFQGIADPTENAVMFYWNELLSARGRVNDQALGLAEQKMAFVVRSTLDSQNYYGHVAQAISKERASRWLVEERAFIEKDLEEYTLEEETEWREDWESELAEFLEDVELTELQGAEWRKGVDALFEFNEQDLRKRGEASERSRRIQALSERADGRGAIVSGCGSPSHAPAAALSCRLGDDPCRGWESKKGTWCCDELLAGMELVGVPATDRIYGGYDLTVSDYGYDATQTAITLFGASYAVLSEAGKSEAIWEKCASEAVTLSVSDASAGAGVGLGVVGVAAGLFELGKSARRCYKTHNHIIEIQQFASRFAAGDNQELTQEDVLRERLVNYALAKKKRKRRRAGVAMAVAGTAVVGGAIGLFLGSNPVGWVIGLTIGLIALLGGLAVFAYRGYRLFSRKRRAKKYAKRLGVCAATKQRAVAIRRVILNSYPGDPSVPQHEIIRKFAYMNECNLRQQMAHGLYGYFIRIYEENMAESADGVTSAEARSEEAIDPTGQEELENFAAGLLFAIGLDPIKIANDYMDAVEADEGAGAEDYPKTRKSAKKWIGKIMGKLKSW